MTQSEDRMAPTETVAGGEAGRYEPPACIVRWQRNMDRTKTAPVFDEGVLRHLLTEADLEASTVERAVAEVRQHKLQLQAMWKREVPLEVAALQWLAERQQEGASVILTHDRYFELVRCSRRDTLTGLVTAAELQAMLRRELAALARRVASLAVLFINLDPPRHSRGARWTATPGQLKTLGRALRSWVRESDLAARAGHDDFLVLLRDVDDRLARRVAGRVHRSASRQLEDMGMTVSVGYAVAPVEAATSDGVLALADERLQHARSLGGDRVCPVPGIPDRG